MKVFSNSGPLLALEKLGQLDLLSHLFGQVYLPPAVYREVVVQGKRRGYPDARLIEIAIRLMLAKRKPFSWPRPKPLA